MIKTKWRMEPLCRGNPGFSRLLPVVMATALFAVGRLGRKKKKARAIARSLRTAAISRALSIFSIIITIKKLSNLIGYQLP